MYQQYNSIRMQATGPFIYVHIQLDSGDLHTELHFIPCVVFNSLKLTTRLWAIYNMPGEYTLQVKPGYPQLHKV